MSSPDHLEIVIVGHLTGTPDPRHVVAFGFCTGHDDE